MAVIGDTLKNSYRIVDKLGEGGQTRVYLAFDVSSNKKCVVKEMKTNPGSADEQECLTLFQREYTLLKDLRHPLLVKVHAFFQEKGLWYIVEDFVEGKTLEAVLKKSSSLPEDMAVLIAVDLADTLGYLHQNNIIYRDIKPANIVIDTNQQAKLIDFSIARVYKSGKNKDTVSIGTPGYSPPEQYGRKQTDARSDVYALGALLYELITARDPADMPFTFRFTQPYPTIKPVIEKATNLDPDKRYQSMAEFKKSLLEEHSKQKTPVAQPTPQVPQTQLQQTPTNQPAKSDKTIYIITGLLGIFSGTHFWKLAFENIITDNGLNSFMLAMLFLGIAIYSFIKLFFDK